MSFFLFLLTSPTTASDINPNASEFILINGGYSLNTNEGDFRKDLIAIQNGIAKGKAKVFDAGGAGTNYLVRDPQTGEYKRSPSGHLVLENENIGFPTEAAVKSSINAAVGATGKSSAPLTVYWGDHGGEDGVCLWNEGTMTPREWRSKQDALPDGKLVRSIHDHCFPDAMLADHAGAKPPATPDKIAEYLKGKYRRNSCGLALSPAHETGTGVGVAKEDPKASLWKEILEKNPFPSLKSVWEGLCDNTQFNGTPHLTTDAIAEDLLPQFCESERAAAIEENEMSKTRSQSDTHTDTKQSKERSAGLKLAFTVCASSRARTQNSSAEILAAQAGSDEVQRIISRLALRVLNRKQPKQLEEWNKAQAEIQRLREELFTREKMGPLSTQVLKSYEQKIGYQQMLYSNIDLELKAVREGHKYADEVNSEFHSPEFQTQLKQDKNEFPYFFERLFMEEMGAEENKKIKILALGATVQAKEYALKGARKDDMIRYMKLRRRFVESKLKALNSDPKLKEAWEHYASIRKCEESKLN